MGKLFVNKKGVARVTITQFGKRVEATFDPVGRNIRVRPYWKGHRRLWFAGSLPGPIP